MTSSNTEYPKVLAFYHPQTTPNEIITELICPIIPGNTNPAIFEIHQQALIERLIQHIPETVDIAPQIKSIWERQLSQMPEVRDIKFGILVFETNNPHKISPQPFIDTNHTIDEILEDKINQAAA